MTKIYKCLTILMVLFAVKIANAQSVSITSSSAVTENFNGMATTATASLPTGWKISAAGDGTAPTYTATGNFTATNQAASTGSPNAGGRWNWGNSGNTADRSIGTMTSGSYANPNAIMVAYQNNTGVQMNDVTIAFDYERFRANSTTCTVNFFTSTNGTSWTARTTGDNTFASGTGYDFTNSAANVVSKSVTITGVNIANGGNFYLRWTINSGSSNSQGVALDNVVLTPTLQSGSAPTQFAITSISPASPSAGNGFNVTVVSRDGSNLAANVSANTGFSLITNGMAGSIGGTTTGTITAGTNSVVVSGVTLSSAGTGVTLTAQRSSGDNLSDGISSPFNVLAAADHISFVGVPSSGTTGTNLGSFTVVAKRPDNSTDDTYTGNVTITSASGPGTLSGTTTVAAVAGVATFSNLQFDQAGTYTLQASSGSFSNITTGNITITQAALSWNFATAAPSSGTPYANLTVSNIIQGNNFGTTTMLSTASASAVSDYASASGGNNAQAAARTGAINTATSGSAYFEFTLTPATGYYVTLNGISFGTRSSGTGPQAYSIRSSKDNYTANLATGTSNNAGDWEFETPTFTSTSSGTGSAIIFRIYGHSGSGSATSGTANWRIDDVTLDLSVQLCNVPTAFNVTGTGSYCSAASGLAVGLSGSESGYSYQLKNGPTNVGSPVTGTGNAISFGTQTAGTYTVIATNPAGACTNNMTGSAVLTVVPTPTVNITSSNVNCNGGTDGSATVSATGGSGFMYSWAPSGGTSATASNLAAGNYTCTVTNSGGCTSTATVSISQPNTLSATISQQNNISCNGEMDGSATVSVSGGTSPYTYSWSPSGGTLTTANNLAAGTYSCTVTDTKGCVTTATVSISEPAVLSATISQQNGISCNGSNDASATVSVSGGTPSYLYSWSPSGATLATATGLSAGTHTCMVTDSHGCVTTATISISQPMALNINISQQGSINCNGETTSAMASVSGGTPAYSYSWSPSGATTATATGLSAGTHTCTVTDAGGCITTATISISQPAALNVTISQQNSISCNGGSNASAMASVSGGTAGYTYSWSPSGATTASASGLSAGTYTCEVTDANGCVATETISISQPSSLVVTTGNALSICNGSNTMLSASSNGGTGNVAFTWMPGQLNGANPTVSPNTTTTYTVTGTDANGCSSTATQMVTVNACVAPTKIQNSQCGITVAAMNTTVYCDAVTNAVNYQFEFTDNTTGAVFIKQRTANFFQFGLYTECGYGRTYSVRARAYVGGNWGSFATSCDLTTPPLIPTIKIQNSQCGTTVAAMNTTVYCDLVSNATNYQFEFTDNATGAVFTKQRTANFFQFGLYTECGYGKTYSIKARAYVAGVWGTYGSACDVTTPTFIPSTQIQSGQCGMTAGAMNTTIYCDAVSNTSIYEFEFTDNATGNIFTKQRTVNFFQFGLYTECGYGKTFSIRVRPYVAGNWGSFGSSCSISTPVSIPTTKIQNSQCGITVAAMNTTVYSDAVPNVVSYEFEFTDNATGIVITRQRSVNFFQFSLYPGVFQASKTYSIRVRVYSGGVWGDFGSACNVSTPSSSMVASVGVENAKMIQETALLEMEENTMLVYPNPNMGDFNIDLKQDAQVIIYNSIGEVIVDKVMNTGTNSVNITDLPSGIYYVRLIDGKNNPAHRIIKQ